MSVYEETIDALLRDATPKDRVDHIVREAQRLVDAAEKLGVSLRIDRRPLQPLATGNAEHVIEAWPARHGPRARPAP